MKRKSTGGAGVHDLSNSYPVLSKVSEREVYVH